MVATREEIQRVLAMLVASFPMWAKDVDDPVLEQTLRVYERILTDLPAIALEAAVLQHIADSRFFPTAGELRQKTMSLLGPRRPSAMEAWGEVKRAFARYGRYQGPIFENQIAARVVESMGWLSLCDSGNEAADRARFIQAYETFCRREQEDALLLPEVRELLAIEEQRVIPSKERGTK